MMKTTKVNRCPWGRGNNKQQQQKKKGKISRIESTSNGEDRNTAVEPFFFFCRPPFTTLS